jgi:hypothetical protein
MAMFSRPLENVPRQPINYRSRRTCLLRLMIVGMPYTSPSRADAPAPLIVIDRWWGVDYAKQVCRIPAYKLAGKSEATCDQERTESYNRFELELKTQFAALPECAGITVASFGYPQNPKEPPPDTRSRIGVFQSTTMAMIQRNFGRCYRRKAASSQ